MSIKRDKTSLEEIVNEMYLIKEGIQGQFESNSSSEIKSHAEAIIKIIKKNAPSKEAYALIVNDWLREIKRMSQESKFENANLSPVGRATTHYGHDFEDDVEADLRKQEMEDAQIQAKQKEDQAKLLTKLSAKTKREQKSKGKQGMGSFYRG